MSQYAGQQPSTSQASAGTVNQRSVVSGRRSLWLILATYTLLTLILTHPLLFNLAATVPNDIGDPLLNTWILAWDSHALLTDPLNLFNANIFYPLPHTLAYSEHLLSTTLLTLPIQLISAEPLIAYNLSLIATFPLAAFGMYLLAFRWTRHRRAAFIAGLIFAFAPYRFAAIAHLQLLTFQWLPYILLFIDIYFSQRRPPYSLLPTPYSPAFALIIFLTLQLLASWYLAIYTLLIVGLYLVTTLLTRRLTRSHLIQLSLSFLISIFLILPLVWPYLALLDDLRTARPLSQALALAATPTDFAAAAPFNRLFGPLTESLRTRPGFTEENTLLVGLVAPFLALASIFVLFFPLSLYSKRNTLHVSRFTLYVLLALLLLTLSLTFSTPYALLAQFIPASAVIRVPPRWIIPALFALAGLAAFGYSVITYYVSRLTPHASRLIFLLTCLFLLAETLSIPLPLAPVENRTTLNPAYHRLATQPGDLTLIELPLHSAPAPEFPEVKRLYASTLGWWQLVNGYSGYTPPRQPLLAQVLTDFPGPKAITALQNLTLASKPSHQLSNPPLFLLVHPGEAPFDRTQWETTTRWQAERNPALLPLDQYEGDYLYQIIPPNSTRFTAPPLATFGQNQTIHLLVYELIKPDLKSKILLYWQPASPLSTDYTVFIHLRAPDGFVRSQADGLPVSGHYPPTTWPPGEIVQDLHSLADTDLTQVDHLAIGLYNPTTGERLAAFDASGKRLADDALIIPLH